ADEVFVIGGASVYKTLIPYCTEVLVTKVDADGGAEVFVPNLDENENFMLTAQSEPVEDNGYTIRFCTYRNLMLKEHI
ncbi:MAG: dihydrofolate reductase, partial [Clostridia bacterium]|nr:dihydrofolate reductase [Clostridia bacterium]